MTTRSRSRSTTPYQRTLQFAIDGVPQDDGTWVETSGSESMTDVVTPNYRDRIKAGDIINNPCFYQKLTRKTIGSGSAVYTHKTGGPNLDHYDGSLTQKRASQDPAQDVWRYPDGGIIPADSDVAKLRALANIDQTPYAFGEDAFELRQTLKFVRKPAHSMHELAIAFYKAVKARKVGSLAQRIADVWLTYRFAFTPLVLSVVDLLEFASKRIPRRPLRLTSRGFAFKESSYSDLYESQTNADHTCYFSRYFHRKEQYHASVLYEASNPLYDQRYNLGFRRKDFPYIIWQVIPYSFMIDRVLDISSSIRAIANLVDPEVNILAASVRRKKDGERKIKLSSQTNVDYDISTSSDLVHDFDYIYSRDVWSPSFLDAVPSLTLEGLVKDATSIADLFALVIARLKAK